MTERASAGGPAGSDGLPLVVFGPRSLEYDFGPRHPLSPRRFGPGIELLRAVGADAGPWLEPEPATDDEIGWLHSAEYVAAVRRFAADPDAALEAPAAGIGPGDDPPFEGMHEAAAVVAGGSIRAMEAILRGEVEHAYQPGGGLHHAMRSKASGFCVYNDVALAIARARRDGLRVLYVDLDVHHGDGVQSLHYLDPGVLTISFHESGHWLFPGTGFVDELGEGTAAGTSVNVPLEPGSGPDAWLAAVAAIVPALAASFGPDVVVSQHGCDGHYWDPLAHLALTTTAMAEAARLVDAVAHRYAGGRWFATGGGGYSVYRVVPRVWALTWLAAAHRREIPWRGRLPEDWRERWSGEASRWGDSPIPDRFEDDRAGVEGARAARAARAARGARAAGGRILFEGTQRGDDSRQVDETNDETVRLVRTVMVPALVRLAEREGWWRFSGDGAVSRVGAGAPPAEAPPAGAPAGADVAAADVAAALAARAAALQLTVLEPDAVERLRLAPRVLPFASPSEARAVLVSALRAGGTAVGAVTGEWLLGIALSAPTATRGTGQVVALGVAPEWRRRGVATALLRGLVAENDRLGHSLVAMHTAAERDPLDPLPRAVRRGVAETLFRAAGFDVHPAPPRVLAADTDAFVFGHGTPPAEPS